MPLFGKQQKSPQDLAKSLREGLMVLSKDPAEKRVKEKVHRGYLVFCGERSKFISSTENYWLYFHELRSHE